jgi:hypothetical protein
VRRSPATSPGCRSRLNQRSPLTGPRIAQWRDTSSVRPGRWARHRRSVGELCLTRFHPSSAPARSARLRPQGASVVDPGAHLGHLDGESGLRAFADETSFQLDKSARTWAWLPPGVSLCQPGHSELRAPPAPLGGQHEPCGVVYGPREPVELRHHQDRPAPESRAARAAVSAGRTRVLPLRPASVWTVTTRSLRRLHSALTAVRGRLHRRSA